MEKDDNVKGNGNSYTTPFRQYAPRIARWLSLDPKKSIIPFESPYNFSNNMPIIGNDPDGDICVPCVLLVLYLLTPDVAIAPTNDVQGDYLKYVSAIDMQTKWMIYSTTIVGLSGSGPFATFMRRELSTQYLTNTGINTVIELSKNRKDLSKINMMDNVFIEAFNGLDLADAYLGKLNFNKLQKVILNTMIDVSPEEASLFGFPLVGEGDDAVTTVKKVSIDMVFNMLSELTGDKIKTGNMKNAVKKLLMKADQVIQSVSKDYIIKNIGVEKYKELMNEINNIPKKVKKPSFERSKDNIPNVKFKKIKRKNKSKSKSKARPKEINAKFIQG